MARSGVLFGGFDCLQTIWFIWSKYLLVSTGGAVSGLPGPLNFNFIVFGSSCSFPYVCMFFFRRSVCILDCLQPVLAAIPVTLAEETQNDLIQREMARMILGHSKRASVPICPVYSFAAWMAPWSAIACNSCELACCYFLCVDTLHC